MIPHRSSCVPALRRRSVTVGAEALAKGGRKVRVLQYRREGDALVTAEGTVSAPFGDDATYALFSAGSVYSAVSIPGYCYLYDLENSVSYYADEDLNDLVLYRPKEGGTALYGASNGKLFRFGQAPAGEQVAAFGGSVLGVYHERLFLASGENLRYSLPLDPSVWEGNGAGSIDLAGEGGDVIALIPFDETLLIFREHEILSLTAKAEDFNFSIVHLDFQGDIVRGSVQNVGPCILFCTQRGVWRYRGSRPELMLEEPYGAAPLKNGTAGVYGGRYFLPVALREGGNAVLVYEPEKGECHLIRSSAVRIAGCKDGLFLSRGNQNYKLTEQGFPLHADAESRAEFELPLQSTEREARLVGGILYGEGEFTLTFEGEYNTVKLTPVKEGRFWLPSTVGGTHVRVRVASKQLSRFEKITLFLREDRL